MKLSIEAIGSIRDMLRLQGVPQGLISTKMAIDLTTALSNITYGDEGSEQETTAALQLDTIKTLFKDMPLKNRVYAITTRSQYFKVRMLGMAIFSAYLNSALENATQTPYWYLTNGDFKRDPPKFSATPSLLVLDSITDQMSQFKMDRVHDTCQTYCDRPILVLHHGQNPYGFCVDTLGVRPSIIINMDTKIEVKRRKI